MEDNNNGIRGEIDEAVSHFNMHNILRIHIKPRSRWMPKCVWIWALKMLIKTESVNQLLVGVDDKNRINDMLKKYSKMEGPEAFDMVWLCKMVEKLLMRSI